MKLEDKCAHCDQPFGDHLVHNSKCPTGDTYFFFAPPGPPLGQCPEWCELPPGHDWEDEWKEGVIRYHKLTRPVGEGEYHHNILIEEVEQAQSDGTIKRQRWLVLDVESPTNLDMYDAMLAVDIQRQLLNLAMRDWPHEGDVL